MEVPLAQVVRAVAPSLLKQFAQPGLPAPKRKAPRFRVHGTRGGLGYDGSGTGRAVMPNEYPSGFVAARVLAQMQHYLLGQIVDLNFELSTTVTKDFNHACSP